MCLFLDETSNAEIIMVFSSRVIEFSIGGKLNDLAVQQIALFREFESTMFPQKIVAAPHQQQEEVTT